MNTVVRLRPPQSEKPTVRGGRGKNVDYRQREYLTEGEIDSLLATAHAMKDDDVSAQDIAARVQTLRHLLKQVGHNV